MARHHAAGTLGALGPAAKAAAPALIRAMRDDEQISVRLSAAKALGQIGGSLMLPLFASVQDDPAQYRRRYDSIIQVVSLLAIGLGVSFVVMGGHLVALVFGAPYAPRGRPPASRRGDAKAPGQSRVDLLSLGCPSAKDGLRKGAFHETCRSSPGPRAAASHPGAGG